MDENEKNEPEAQAERPAEQPDEAPAEQPADIDAAKLSDEDAQAAARAFLGTAEPEPDGISGDEAKSVLRRAGAVAEAEPEPAPAAAPTAEPAVDTGRRWYVIHTYSGYENKVKTNLEHRIQSMDMGDKIFQVLDTN